MSAAAEASTPRWLRASLWRQLLMPLVGLWVASALVATGCAYWLAGLTTNRSFDRLLADDARALAAQLRWQDGNARFVASRETADSLVFDSLSLSHYAVRTASGRKLVGDLALPPPDSLPRAGEPLLFDHRIADGGPMLRAVALRIQPAPSDEAVWVVVGESKAKRKQVTNEIAVAIFLPSGLAGFVIIPLLYYGIRRGLAPTRRLSALVRQQGENDLSPLDVDEVPEELRELVQHTNVLLERLKASVHEQRRFIADAAHQLQTPMAGIRLLVGDMRRTQRADPQQPMDALVLAQLDEVATRGARLVKQLLAYARIMDNSGIPSERFDAVDAVLEAAARWQATAEAAGKSLRLETHALASAGLYLEGSPVLLGEAVSNLLDNAIRYGGPHVLLELDHHDHTLVTRVRDDGPPLDAATREHLLLPFWRGNHGLPEGSGLGLSIALRIVERHGGSLSLQSDGTAPGTCFEIRLPCASETA